MTEVKLPCPKCNNKINALHPCKIVMGAYVCARRHRFIVRLMGNKRCLIYCSPSMDSQESEDTFPIPENFKFDELAKSPGIAELYSACHLESKIIIEEKP